MTSSSGRELGPISAVVVNYQGEQYLQRCIAGLLALEDAPTEIIVVDNASTDDGLAILEEHFPTVRVLQLGYNGGPSVARNVGMRAAQNRWVLAIDNDVYLKSDCLTRLRRVAEERTDAVVVQPRSVLAHDNEHVHYNGGSLHYAGLIALRNFYTPIDQAVGQGVCEVDVSVSLCLLLDKQVLLDAGGYDEAYFIMFEDLDMSCRLRLAGHTMLSVEDCIVEHDAGTAGLSFRDDQDYPSLRVFYHSRNRWLYMMKCMRWRTLLFILPGIVVYELVWFLFALLKGNVTSWFRGKCGVLTLLPQLLEKRRVVQSARVCSDRSLFVGGPMTVSPALRQSGLSRLLIGVLDGWLRAWWGVARWFCG